MVNKSAVRPSFYKEFTTQVEEVIETPEVGSDQEALSYITHFKGWALMKDYQERLNEFLDDSLTQAIANGATMKEIGERAVVKDLAKYVLNSFVKKAEDARRSTDK